MKLIIRNQQRRLRVNTTAMRRLAQWLANRALDTEKWTSVTLILTDNAGIIDYNLAVFGGDYVTDVISCTYEPLPGEAAGLSGELALNVERADDVAAGRVSERTPADWSASHELALYIAHGLDHLSGNDDASPRQRAAMRRREMGWLADAPTVDIVISARVTR